MSVHSSMLVTSFTSRTNVTNIDAVQTGHALNQNTDSFASMIPWDIVMAINIGLHTAQSSL